MKKIFSTLLILCMVLTSLSVGVSASYTLPTTDANYNSFLFDSAYAINDNLYNVGEWRLSNADGSEEKTLGTITEHTDRLGMKFKKFEFEAGNLTGATANSKLSIRGEINATKNYGTTYSQGDCGNEYISIADLNTIIGAKDIDEDGVIDANSGSAVKYTVYAYSKLEDGEPISFNFMRSAGVFGEVFEVPASKLYSEDEIPHKIDVVFYHNGSNANPMSTAATDDEQNFEIWIDGLFYQHGNMSTTKNTKTSHFVFLSPNINLASDSTGAVSWKASELYICSSPDGTTGSLTSVGTTGGNYFKVYTRDTLHNELFQTATYGSNPTVTPRTGFVTGVVSEFATALEASYKDGEQVVKVDEGIYNNPASIWDADATESSVSLVKKEDGTVCGITDKANITGTFADYYITVNGVYTKVEIAPVSYNTTAKTVNLTVSKLPEGTDKLQIVVAAYNADGKLEKVKVSEAYTDFTSNITYTIDDVEFPTDAYGYKVFVFDSITSAKPIMEALKK